MKTCKYCGAQIADDSRFCTECGKEITQANVCPHCGASISENDSFCQNCGKGLNESPNSNQIVYEEEVSKSGFKKYLPYFIGAFVLLAIIGYFNSNNSKDSDDLQSQTELTDSIANGKETSITDTNSVIADFDDNMVYQGEYVFDAVLTDATLEKKESTFTIKIEGNKVSIPSDGHTMTGYIYNDDLGIDVFYDYGDNLHYLSMTLKPNDREGKEWVGEFQPTGILYNAVLKLKECKRKGNAVKITKERTSNNDTDEDEESGNNDWLQGHWVYEQGSYKGHFIIQGDKIIQYSSSNPERQESTFRIEDGAIRSRLIDGMDLVVPIDFVNHRIDYGDGNWMHKINSSSDDNTYSNSHSSSKTFANEQYVTMYLANQKFKDNGGLTILFDGNLRMYIDGDYAGVVSVLRYNSTSALLRYGGGQYGEGKISVKIVNDKLQLTDPTDGTVYYQR